MAQFGGYQDAQYQQQQQAPGVSPSPVQHQPHSKRRHYPTPQYDFSNPSAAAPGYGDASPNAYPGAAAPQANFYPGAPGYGVDPAAGSGPGVFTPAGVSSPLETHNYSQPTQANTFSSQFSNLSLGGALGYGQQTTPVPANVSLNQLYNIDLLGSLPPPISDLSLPPPPVILPSGAGDLRNPDANASSDYVRSTLNVVPTSNSLLKKSKLPFSLIFRPYTSLLEEDAPVPVTKDTTVCRCDRCRAYINPFVRFSSGDKWICNICDKINQIPAGFDGDYSGRTQSEYYSRPEIKYGVCEFIAPPQYLVRPPQAPTYVFLLDVSSHAVESGLLATAAKTIQESLDRIPNKNDLTKVAFIGVDSCLHYFHIPAPPSEAEPSIVVVSDLEDPFLPLPSGILVKLSECRASIDLLLSKLGEMFSQNKNPNNALGSALRSAHNLISNIGGKVICLTATLPNVGHSKLTHREDRKFFGTPKETNLLKPASAFYKNFAIECNKNQITVDMFLFSHKYQDVASLSSLPHFTGGQTYFYPGWSAGVAEDTLKFASDFSKHLSMEISMEAVLKVRSSSGIQVRGYHGNFFNRSEELCSFPTFPRDQSYSVDLSITDTITKPFVSFQIAVLLTTCSEERRIRVITLSLPTSSSLSDIYASADQLAITAHLTHAAIEKATGSGLQAAREFLDVRLFEMLQTYKKDLMATNIGSSSPLQFCANLRMLPLLVNALGKHIGLRKSVQIPSDMRSAALSLLGTLPIKYLIKYIYPDFFSLYDMPEEAGLPNEETGIVTLPPKQNLISERIAPHGLYLIDDGQTIFIWVGRDVVPQLCLDAFGVASVNDIPTGKTEFPEYDSELNNKIRTIIQHLREKKDSVTRQSLFIVKEAGDPSMRLWAASNLVEDRTDGALSYHQYLTSVRDKLNA